MFSSFMMNTWLAASMAAVIAGVVGLFAVMRGSTFAAHALPQGAFAGAAGASLIGANTILGLGVFAVGGAFAIAWLGRRGRQDVATALTLVFLLATGALFLSVSLEYAPEVYSLLFGEVLGVSSSELLPLAALGCGCLVVLAACYRPLLLSSVLPDLAAARGVKAWWMDLLFLIVLALATTMTVPVVGAFLIFSLMIGPAAAARVLTSNPAKAAGLSVALALLIAWAAVAVSYLTQWPVGFFVGIFGFGVYVVARGSAPLRIRLEHRPG